MQCHCPFTGELPPPALGDALTIFCHMIALLPSPTQADDMSSNNLRYLLGRGLFVDAQHCEMQSAVTRFYYCNKLILIFICLWLRSFKTVLRENHLTELFKS